MENRTSRWAQLRRKSQLEIVRVESALELFFSSFQQREDAWSSLQEAAAELLKLENGKRSARVAEVAKQRKLVSRMLSNLSPLESYFAFPGNVLMAELKRWHEQCKTSRLDMEVTRIVRSIETHTFRRRQKDDHDQNKSGSDPMLYFEVLVVCGLDHGEERATRSALRGQRRHGDKFSYEMVFVASVEDAVAAVLFNPSIQVVLIGDGAVFRSTHPLQFLRGMLPSAAKCAELSKSELSVLLANQLLQWRPELDIFQMTRCSIERAVAHDNPFRRIFYTSGHEAQELHLSVLAAIADRYETPFFNALADYSRHPFGVFHALPVSRGSSLTKSHWLQDFYEFYGPSLFNAETSATAGLDSLLDPTGPIMHAQQLAAETFGAMKTYFVTNGTSTANKIVSQAVCRPGDIVMIDRNCHKSHHYNNVLLGTAVVFLDAYPLGDLAMYGGVPLATIKRTLLSLKREGRLDQVRMLLLTNCTFDGHVYNVIKVMQECLAIKPDLLFLWDEAWFAFARFAPLTRQRTAMFAAAVLQERYASAAYRAKFERWRATVDLDDDETFMRDGAMPDPDHVRVTVFATQSTHKTLTSLRQGSMIHVFDVDFKRDFERSFTEAYFTHTSTSPNYQIIASLDAGRRQMALEGFELVSKQIQYGIELRRMINSHASIGKYFRALNIVDMIPQEFRCGAASSSAAAAASSSSSSSSSSSARGGLNTYVPPDGNYSIDWNQMMQMWGESGDEFVLDPCRVTLQIANSGMDGNTFKCSRLAAAYDIQVNKTSINSLLFMTTIGTDRSSLAYLVGCLAKETKRIDTYLACCSTQERRIFDRRVHQLTHELPPLPNFSRFAPAFSVPDSSVKEGFMRDAFFLGYSEDNCEYVALTDPRLDDIEAQDREFVAANMLIPYPPGFPLLVPGQVFSQPIIDFFRKLDVSEIHGYNAAYGLRLFTEEAIERFKVAQKATLGRGSTNIGSVAERPSRQAASDPDAPLTLRHNPFVSMSSSASSADIPSSLK